AVGTRALALFNLGRHREAVMLARGMATLADEAGALREQALARLGVSIFLIEDDPRQSLSAAIESADLARRGGQRGIEVVNLLNAAELSLYLGEWSDTRAAITELGQRDLPLDDRAFLDYIETALAALSGGAAEAAPRLERHAERISVTESVVSRANFLRTCSVVSLAAGDIEAAYRQAADAVSADPRGINSPYALAIQARAALWLRDVERVRDASAAMKHFRGRWMAAERLTVEAGLDALEGRAADSAKAYGGAIEAWRELDCTLDLALCE